MRSPIGKGSGSAPRQLFDGQHGRELDQRVGCLALRRRCGGRRCRQREPQRRSTGGRRPPGRGGPRGRAGGALRSGRRTVRPSRHPGHNAGTTVRSRTTTSTQRRTRSGSASCESTSSRSGSSAGCWWRHGLGEEGHYEVGPDPALVVGLHLVDEPVGGVAFDEVRPLLSSAQGLAR
jgi:hypothetical protein